MAELGGGLVEGEGMRVVGLAAKHAAAEAVCEEEHGVGVAGLFEFAKDLVRIDEVSLAGPGAGLGIGEVGHKRIGGFDKALG